MRKIVSNLTGLVVTASAAQVVWLASMVMLWAWVFDASGDSMLLSVAAVVLSVATAGRIARPLRGMAWRVLKFADMPLWEPLAALGQSEDVRGIPGKAITDMFGSAVFCSVVSSLVSMVLAFLAVRFVALMNSRFLFTPFDWAVLKVATQWVAMLPMAVGIVGMIGAGSLMRQADPASREEALILRHWLGAIALGMAGFGVAWWLGVDMLPLAGLMAVVMVGVGVVCLTVGPEVSEYTPPVFRPAVIRARDTGKNVICFAVLALVLVVQMRLLGDFVGVTMIGRVLWVAASLALMAAFGAWASRETGPADINEAIGVSIGVVAAVGGQMARGPVGRLAARLFLFGCLSGIVMQIPVAALAARLIVHRRQSWSERHGSLMGFLSVAGVGVFAGIVTYLVSGLLPSNGLIPLVVVGVGLGATSLGARRATGRELKGLWMLNGALLVISTILVVAMPLAQLADQYGRASRGVWLSLFGQQSNGSEQRWRPESSLPYPRTWRSAGVTEAMEEVFLGQDEFDSRRGRWWVIATSHRDRPDRDRVPGVYSAQSVPDPTAMPQNYERSFLMFGSEGNYLAASQVGQGLFEGLLLAPLPADHPEAWRCYNERTIRRCVNRIQPGGVIMLRTQVSGDNTESMVAVTETFNRVVGPAWGVAEFHDNVIDLLLIGPRQWDEKPLVQRPSSRPGVIVFPSEFVQDDQMHVRPIQILHPQGRGRGRTLSYSRLQAQLGSFSDIALPDVPETTPENQDLLDELSFPAASD